MNSTTAEATNQRSFHTRSRHHLQSAETHRPNLAFDSSAIRRTDADNWSYPLFSSGLTRYTNTCIWNRAGQASILAGLFSERPPGVSSGCAPRRRIPATARSTWTGTQRLEANDRRGTRCYGNPYSYWTRISSLLCGQVHRGNLCTSRFPEANRENAER